MEEDLHGPRLRRPRRAVPGREPDGAARPRARLRVERDDRDVGQRRHVRRGAVPGRRPLHVARASAGRWTSSTARTRGRRTLSDQTPPGSRDADRATARCTASSTRAGRCTARRSRSSRRARPTSTRPTARSGSSTSTTRRRCTTRSRSARRSAGSTSLFNWGYIDADHIAYQLSGWMPQRAKRTSPDFPVLGTGAVRLAGLQPRPAHDEDGAAGPPPARGRPALPRVVEQQAGAGLGGGRRQVLLRADLPLADDRAPRPGRDPRPEARRRSSSSSRRWRSRRRRTCARGR